MQAPACRQCSAVLASSAGVIGMTECSALVFLAPLGATAIISGLSADISSLLFLNSFLMLLLDAEKA